MVNTATGEVSERDLRIACKDRREVICPSCSLEAAMPEHLRLIALLATWCQLRRAELLGLPRKDIDVANASLRVEQSRAITMRVKSLVKPPKTAAGRRTIAVPEFLIERIRDHLGRFTGPEPDALMFTGITGVSLTGIVLQVAWQRARLKVGRTDLRLHDLRHTGLTMAAATGATTVERMHRAGHLSSVAAMRYQHATRDRDRILLSSRSSKSLRRKSFSESFCGLVLGRIIFCLPIEEFRRATLGTYRHLVRPFGDLWALHSGLSQSLGFVVTRKCLKSLRSQQKT
jgi:hypothetical protein